MNIKQGFHLYRRQERNGYIKEHLRLVNEQERMVIGLRYQLDDPSQRDRTLTSIALELGFSRERARQIHDKGMVRILGFRSEDELPVYLRPVWRKMQKYPDWLNQRNKARQKALYAINRGNLLRQPCQVCGTTNDIEAHHHDYSKPLDVHWLCERCHKEEHRQRAHAHTK